MTCFQSVSPHSLQWIIKKKLRATEKSHVKLFFLRIIQHFLSTQRPTYLIHVTKKFWTLILYNCLTYDSLTKFLDLKLLKLQNRCIRFIFNIKKDTSITPFRRKLKWLTPSSRRKYFMGVLIYNTIMHKRPHYLYSIFENFYSIPSRILRSNIQQIFDTPFVLGRAYDSSFQNQAMKFWNQLPLHIRNCENVNIFKTKLFKLLFDLDKNN